jgi:tripartite-type tricarboxylate transporter receptor subunit TctC
MSHPTQPLCTLRARGSPQGSVSEIIDQGVTGAVVDRLRYRVVRSKKNPAGFASGYTPKKTLDYEGRIALGSSGLGSILHLCGEQFKALAGGINIAHVPYRGSAPMMSDLVAGQISMAFDATPTALPQARSGAIRAIGAGMATRMRAMPELPTLQEQGLKGFECYTWNAILAPASTPQPIVDRLSEAINKALADPAVFNRLQEVGIDPTPGSTPQRAAEFIKAELAKWAPIIKASGAQID